MPEPFPFSISVVLPAFNEEECIEKAVVDCARFLPDCFRDWEVIVVDDGSTDRTADIVRRLGEQDPHVKLVRHPRNRGYGAAIASGFRATRGEVVFYTDADSQFDVRELKDVAALLADHDVVLGFRVYRYDSVLRCFLSWVYNRLVRLLFHVKVRDVDCSFKLFRRAVIERLQLESTDFFIDTEIVARVGRMGVKTIERGVRHYPRMAGRTSVRASDIPRTLKTVARMWLKIRFPRREATAKAAAAAPATQTRPVEPS